MRNIAKRIVSAALALAMLAPAPVRAVDYHGSESYRTGKYYRALQEVTLTGDPRTDIVNIALSQVGYQESAYIKELSGEIVGNANFTEYGGWYDMQDQWCAMFVSWCAALAGISDKVVPKHSYTPNGLYWMKDKWGRAYSRAKVEAGAYTPQPGDIIYFKSPTTKATTNHVGIVTGYRDGIVYTVEGNTSSPAIFSGGGTVARKSYPITNTYIVYICCPDYEGTGPRVMETKTETPKTTTVTKKQTDDLAVLRKAIYAIETGGESDYDRIAASYAGGITIGSGQWYGMEAKELLMRIRKKYSVTFERLDTAGIGKDLDEQDWSSYRISADSEKAECIRQILGSSAGIKVQDEMMNERLRQYQKEAAALGVTNANAQLLCAGLCHFGGTGVMKRVLDKVQGDYTVENICAAIEAAGYASQKVARVCSAVR